MFRQIAIWLIAFLVTAASAFWQRISGPSYPVSGRSILGGQEISWKLTRSHAVTSDQPVEILVANEIVSGEVAWKRYKTSDPWQVFPMRREGDWLKGALPRQPPAGKIEYQVRLHLENESVVFPEKPAVSRYKGEVSPVVLIPHILLLFAGMLLAVRVGLDALMARKKNRSLLWATLGCFLLGGLILGPIIQKAAFGAFWTGWPFGNDLTDNKTVVAVLCWMFAIWRARGDRQARGALLAAAVVTLLVFAIPHSTWGSELDWSKLDSTPSVGFLTR